jgi:hypothetical protein
MCSVGDGFFGVRFVILQNAISHNIRRASLTGLSQIGCKTVHYDQFSAKISEKKHAVKKGLQFD